MIDIKVLRKNLAEVKNQIIVRYHDDKQIIKVTNDLDKVIEFDTMLRKLKTSNQTLEQEKNQVSKAIRVYISKNQLEQLKLAKSNSIKLKKIIESNNNKINELNTKITEILWSIPNLIDESVPIGSSSNDNKEIRKYGPIVKNENLPHWEIAQLLNLTNDIATKLSGSRFAMYSNLGAQLIRALINFMLDENIKAGYQEYAPPLIVNKNILIATGQLPKFAVDLFKISDHEQYLIPTAEVPLTNIYRNSIIKSEKLPFKFCAYTPCFRSEAGAAGKDTRGLIRLHQFHKVELVQIVDPVYENEALENLVSDAENILKLLVIPYRTIVLCSGDTGFSASKTYDIELWMPGQKSYREVSSCSKCGSYQAIRMNMRLVYPNGTKNYPHTLNGSALAVDRVFAAILENYYNKNTKTLVIPKVLHKYMNGIKEINSNK